MEVIEGGGVVGRAGDDEEGLGVSELKREFEKAFVEMYVLDVDIEDKSLELEEKSHAAAKLAKASGKSLEWERKSQELVSRESALQKKREREAHDATIRKHREELWDWHKKLQDVDESLRKCQRFIIRREVTVNEMGRTLKKKETALEKAQSEIESTNRNLKKK
ncbi:hypothetical protein Acr_29g0004800 [Actinidia rufa]|uniref:Uncharacterized protein n=1 Tax=Actinidia rufa TaxID=165716 RepID=A0A7J0HE29_9ERIC|nr:hypothetical protein Acr_29g0004800 [Actinidia rufa]